MTLEVLGWQQGPPGDARHALQCQHEPAYPPSGRLPLPPGSHLLAGRSPPWTGVL